MYVFEVSESGMGKREYVFSCTVISLKIGAL